MLIIKLNADTNGSRPALRKWDGAKPPKSYALCPERFYELFYSTTPAGFVDITVEDGIVTSMAVNNEALEAYVASIPERVITPEKEIAELKKKLADTDYMAIKYAEGVLSEKEYAEMKAQRQAWRDRINELEALIGGSV